MEHIYLDWRRGRHLQLPEGSTIQGGILTIPVVTKEAEGEYICLGLDRHGSILFEAKSILEVVCKYNKNVFYLYNRISTIYNNCKLLVRN